MCFSGVTEEEEDEEEEDEDLSDLLLHFHKLHVGEGPLCQKHFDRPVGIKSRDIHSYCSKYGPIFQI